MFFDRYEIHIQAFVDFINGKLIIFNSSSPWNYFEHTYSKNIDKIFTKHIQNTYRIYSKKIYKIYTTYTKYIQNIYKQ